MSSDIRCEKKMPWVLLWLFLMVPCQWNCAPLPQNKLPSKEVEGFLKRFGYIETKPGVEVADALYTEEGFREVVQQMQRFGGLPETGELDEATLNLTKSPRCGVPDVVRTSSRKKRYIIGSEAWRKRKLTYFLANWPPELDPQLVRNKLAKALGLWSEVAPLRFVPRESMDADLIVAFGRGPHGDGYPFDGPGSILAHAFFPYEHDAYGGDIHFDDDEYWIDGANGETDGVDFYTVAAHEIGHSLGLAHSTVPGSIMFPYYKGYNAYMRLDYDDIVAMYSMYVLKGDFEDTTEEVLETSTDGYSHSPDLGDDTTDETSRDSNNDGTQEDDSSEESESDYSSEDEDYYDMPDVSDYSSEKLPEVSSPTPEPKEVTSSSEDLETTPAARTTAASPRIPDLCEGTFDAGSVIRGELFIFKGLFTWRLRDRGEVLPAYPVYFHSFFLGLPRSVNHIDAVYERPNDYHILFFVDREFWIYDGNRFTEDSPHQLTELGLPADIEKVDAAIVWGKNGKTYLFSGGLYWRYDEEKKKMDSGYPQRIARWRGLPGLDAAFTWTDGRTYFFKGKEFWRFNNKNVSVDPGFPLPTAAHWFGCS